MIRMFALASVLCTLAATSACSNQPNQAASSTDLTEASNGSLVLQNLTSIGIVDLDGRPVPNAKVLIGTAANQPFPNNLVTANSAGVFAVPAQWKTELPVTISANGFVRTTYMAQLPTRKTFAIRAKAAAVKPELNGTTAGFGTLKKDGFVDVGIVIPALSYQELANFQASTLLSPESDTITVVGQKAELPSNITLPDQTESIFPISVRLNKPNYRMYFSRRGTHKVVSAHVKFPLKKVIEQSQSGNSGIGLVNHFTFLGAGINNAVFAGDKLSLNLPVNQIQFTSKIPVQAPAIATTQTMLSVSLVKDGTYLYPTDMKTTKRNEAQSLNFPQGRDGVVLNVLRNEVSASTGAATEALSLSLNSALQSQQITFLDIANAPKVANGSLILNPPNKLAQLTAAATLATLSNVEIKVLGKNSYEVKHPLWDIYAADWAGEIVLPNVGSPASARKQRWEASFLAYPQGTKAEQVGPGMLKAVTHLTRSAVDL